MARAGNISRRDALLGGCAAFGLPLWACAAPAEPAAARVVEVAAGVFVRAGVDAEAGPRNDNGIANTSFIVGQRSVAVVDPGGSLADGARLRAAIAHRTRLPVSHVVFSHAHPDHIFGAGAFTDDEPLFVGHQRLPAALAASGDYYRQRLEQVLGAGAAGPVVVPTLLVTQELDIDLGGRVLMLRAHGVAHSDCDLSLVDSRSATLLAGDLLFVRRVPALEGRIKGWQRELAFLKTLPVRRAVPGHGPASVHWPNGAAALDRYLRVVQSDTREAIHHGVEIEAAVGIVGTSERGRWTLFDEYHGHNVTQAYKELEWE